MSAITRDRVIDKSLRRQINDWRLYVFEKHFTEDQFIQRKYCQNIYLLENLTPSNSIGVCIVEIRGQFLAHYDDCW